MSKRATIEEYLSAELVLAKEVTIVDVELLPQSLQEQLEAEEGDSVISKRLARDRSKVIDGELAELLSRFKEPKKFLSVVQEYAKEQEESAVTLLDGFLEPCISMIAEGYLVSPLLEEEERKELPLVDERFEGYRLIYKVHQTEDTQLYLAEDEDKNFVALKIGMVQNSESMMALLKREVEVLNTLPRGIAPKLLYEHLEGEFPYIATAWVEGVLVTQYAQKVREEGNRDALVKLFADIVKRYDGLHQHGWLHQDIHPGNMMYNQEGEIRLIDFGLAQRVDSLYQVKAGVHTYMAPESIHHLEKVDNVASEQYAIATILYELFTGTPYIDFSLRTETMYEQLKSKSPRAFDEVGVEPFKPLEKILFKALRKEPSERFKSLSLLYDALKEIPLEGEKSVDKKQLLRHKFSLALFQNFNDEGELYQKGLPSGPIASLFYGEAGVAYALYRYALMEDSAYHLSLAERWIVKASLHATQKDAFSNPTFGDDDLDIAYSTYNHQVGIYGVQAFIAYAKGDFIQVNQSVAMILNASEGEVRGEDLTLDALSISLLFIHLLQRDVGNIIELKLREEMEHRIELMVLEYLEEPSLGAFSLEPKQVNLGMAHGVAGRLYTILKWCSYKNMMPSKLFFKKLDALIALKIPYGRGSCIPWQGVEQKSFNTMSGWCNGSSGMAMLLCEVVKITEKKSYLEVAKKFVFHCWEDGSSVANLCCGLAGRAYALAYYSEVSGESIWHRRALLLLNRAIEEVQQIDTEEMPKHSLYKGQLGVALATLEIEEQSGYSMPFFGSEL